MIYFFEEEAEENARAIEYLILGLQKQQHHEAAFSNQRSMLEGEAHIK